jgi:hypothetical protein
VEPKDPPDQAEPALPVLDEWGLPVPAPPAWTEPADVELGYTAGEDDEDRWD